ncbi:glutathione S-transferase family protein [Entomomonas asaccharolytica]|uniref:Glutathione S-transferase family protein n=1 Tax=Entomomonas asaccharolytica TaxID=2785331 RepID=A0A974NG81_9GAMM|nr:glutathione S-transferase family protein [Entomomonas asaccharolytica]QQP86086.1 glutathione S-transferase family protein [Entomomonas asaccharolytica]
MLTPHILGPEFSSFLRTVRLYCEELAINYTYGLEIDGKNITLGSEALKQYHPFKKVPVLIYNNTAIFETTTICRFLDNISKPNNLTPKDPLTIALVDEWANALSLYIDKILIRQYVVEFAFPKGPNKTIRQQAINEIKPKVIETLELLDKQLTDKPFFCGTFYSMADAILTPMLDYVAQTPESEALFNNTKNLLPYLTNMKERPSGRVVFQK